MANKGSKKPLKAWSQRVPGRNAPKAFPTPIVPGALDATGLLPRALLDLGVTVEVDDWGNPGYPGDQESITLQIARIGSQEFEDVVTRTVAYPIMIRPIELVIPSTFLLDEQHEGEFRLRYHHINWNSEPAFSDEAPIIVDKIPPNFPNPPGKMTFDFGLGPIYDATLDGINDIEGIIPQWTGAMPGDKVAFTWLIDKLPDNPDDIVPIDVVTLGADRKVKIPVSVIKAGKDGKYCGGYTIFDKAGNRSSISQYDLISVALGKLPVAPLPAPEVPEAEDGSVNRDDALVGVYVEFPVIENGKSTDDIEVSWGGTPLDYRVTVGANDKTFSISMPTAHMKTAYGTATGEVETEVLYTVYRGVEPFKSHVAKIQVDFSMPGPENPDWPDPTNTALGLPDVYGESGDKNILIAADENQRAYAEIELVDPLVTGDTYQLYWNGAAIGTSYEIDTTTDSVGDVIEIDLDWEVIRAQGNNTKMPVHFTLSSASHTNDQKSKASEVEINFLTVTLPAAIPQNLVNNRLTCRSLHYDDAGNIGFQYLIPPSAFLKEGMTVGVEWKAYMFYSAPVLLPNAGLTATLGPISAEEAANGVMWFIEPYAEKILPTWVGPTTPDTQTGKGEVIYTLEVNGSPVLSTASDTQVVLSAGSGTCVLNP